MPTTAPSALVIVDVQKAIDDPSWGDDRNNPHAEENIARLLERWRERRWPVFHIRHVSRDLRSTYRDSPFKDEVLPRHGEHVIEKSTNSAFIGTSLERELTATQSQLNDHPAPAKAQLPAIRQLQNARP